MQKLVLILSVFYFNSLKPLCILKGNILWPYNHKSPQLPSPYPPYQPHSSITISWISVPQSTETLKEIINIEHSLPLFYFTHITVSLGPLPNLLNLFYLPKGHSFILPTCLTQSMSACISDKVWYLNFKKPECWLPILIYYQPPQTHTSPHHYCYIYAPLQAIIMPDTPVKGDTLESHFRCFFVCVLQTWLLLRSTKNKRGDNSPFSMLYFERL